MLQKLDWYVKGGGISDRQWTDVVGVIKAQGDALDRVYMRKWSKHLGVDALLEKALGQADGA